MFSAPAASTQAQPTQSSGFGAATIGFGSAPAPQTGFGTASVVGNVSAPEVPPLPSFIPILQKGIELRSMQKVAAEIKKRFAFSEAQTLSVNGAMGTPSASQLNQQRQLASELVELLLFCKGTHYHPGVETAQEHVSDASDLEEKMRRDVHGAVSSIANSASNALVNRIRERITSSVKKGSGEMARVFTLTSRNRGNGAHTSSAGTCSSELQLLLLEAQCLYLLSRNFPMEIKCVTEVLETVGDLLRVIQKDSVWRRLSIRSFQQSRGSATFSALTWLLLFTALNAVAPWRRKYNANGILEKNILVQVDVSILSNFLSQLSKDMSIVTNNSNGSITPLSPVVNGFVSILYMALGCWLRGKGDDSGYDRALEAFLGNEESFPGFKGKVAKRMVQLVPLPALLAVPVVVIYESPYEVLSYLFDEMLPLLRHVSELEIGALHQHLEQLQLFEELPQPSSFTAVGEYTPESAGLAGRGGTGENLESRLNPLRQAIGNIDRNDGAGRREDTMRMLTPFTSEMAHILEALTVCLQELPGEYLDPDVESDCAATWFIFRNCVKHLCQALKMVSESSSSVIWESYAFKLVARFVDVLTMIGRQSQYMTRIGELLAGAQSECPEIRWEALTTQVLACVGFTTEDRAAAAGGMAASSAFGIHDTRSDAAPARPLSDVIKRLPMLLQSHHQFTEAYAWKTKQMFIKSFFLLLRQMLRQPELRTIAQQHFTLPVVLSFLCAPQQSPSTLGSVLSLLSSLIANHEDAMLVWDFLDSHKLLSASNAGVSLVLTSTDSNSHISSNDSAVTHDPTATSLSLLGHCRFECSHGSYSITIGFLNLFISIMRHSIPPVSLAFAFEGVVHFIAQDIVCGIHRRSFNDHRERYTVLTLAVTALRRALLVHFSEVSGGASSSLPSSVIPFASILACSLAPTDVVGEIQICIEASISAKSEVLSHQRAAIRQCLRLLQTAVHVVVEQKLKIFSFDVRTTQDSSLASKLLVLAASRDMLLAKAALELALLFPQHIVAEAARLWNVDHEKLHFVTKAFASLLHPNTVLPPTAEAEPLLAVLYDEGLDALPETQLVDVKELMLDLLTQHARASEPSITAWMCGFLSAPVNPLNSTEEKDSASGNARQNTPLFVLLPSVLEGATCSVTEEHYPALAVKYVKLLYALRSSSLYGVSVMRLFAESHCCALYSSLLDFVPSKSNPLLLGKYAYIVQLLSLEMAYVYQHSPEKLSLRSNAVPSLVMEISLSLLQVSRNNVDELKGSISRLLGDKSVSPDSSPDVTQWLLDVLRSLPTFPSLPVLPGGSEQYLVKATDQVTQYNITELLRVLHETQPQVAVNPQSAKEYLLPYVHANHCFLVYASSENFLNSLCQFLALACSAVKGVSADRLRLFVGRIMEALEATSVMTLATQERIAYRLCHTLSSLITMLSKLANESSEAPAIPSVSRVYDPFTSMMSEMPLYSRCSIRTAPLVVTSPNQALLRPVVEAILRWGSKLPCIRLDLYDALLMLSVTKGVSVHEDLIMYRVQQPLLQLLVDEVCQPYHEASRYKALTVLLQLVQSSPSISAGFCCEVEGSGDGLGPLALRCFHALFAAVDSALIHVTMNVASDVHGAQQLTRAAFYLLTALSLDHSPQLLQGNTLLRCMGMEIWTRSSQIVLGHAVSATKEEGNLQQTLLEQGQRVVLTLFLEVMRWIHVMASTESDSYLLQTQIQQFFAQRRPLVDFLLQTPLRSTSSATAVVDPSSTAPSSARLPLLVALSWLLRDLVATPSLIEQCRGLRAELAIPHLLCATVQSGSFLVTDAALGRSAGYGERSHAASVREASLIDDPSRRGVENQADERAQIIHSLADFLLRCEYGNRGNNEIDLTSGTSSENAKPHLLRATSLLRHSPHDVGRVLLSIDEISEQLRLCSVKQRTRSIPPRRLNFIITALHSLTLLLQSFALPLCGKECDTCGAAFPVYLRNSSLARYEEVLKTAQQAIYRLYADLGNEGETENPSLGPLALSATEHPKNFERAAAAGKGGSTDNRSRSTSPPRRGSTGEEDEGGLVTESSLKRLKTGDGAAGRVTPPSIQPPAVGSKRTLHEYLPNEGQDAELLLHTEFETPSSYSLPCESNGTARSLRLLKIILSNTIRTLQVSRGYAVSKG